ncbi:uncharacterized protein BCR38DRAFT_409168 [Pseudomassariella vexata]|uniref:SET domain-containing protein n=1 Tax=Pseudomassariella vexata TaxID=1141098 RepID=A0A1Y2E2C4_9PEZI|nr:uncharacterized protein BCR38DRAFT_409168 [Pseudomassariella vexata]ORY65476.1 hypothetical protein BCR38DRAFT_409168 [Pseudomassariella vexata]
MEYPKTENETCYEVREIPQKHKGMVATRDIPVGELILREKYILACNQTKYPAETKKLMEGFDALSDEKQSQVMALWKHETPGYDIIFRESLRACRQEYDWLPESQDNEFLKFLHIFQTNAYMIQVEEMDDDEDQPLLALFIVASRINHSCYPNTTYRFEDKKYMTIRASRPIVKGEEITNYYVSAGNPSRKSDLQVAWGFECACPVCCRNDPTVDSDAFEKILVDIAKLKNSRDTGGEINGIKVVRKFRGDQDRLKRMLDQTEQRLALYDKLNWVPELRCEHATRSDISRHLWDLTKVPKYLEIRLESAKEAIRWGKVDYGPDTNFFVPHFVDVVRRLEAALNPPSEDDAAEDADPADAGDEDGA